MNQPDQTNVVTVDGRLDALAAGPLRSRLTEEAGPGRLVVDLRTVGFLDSAGLAALVAGMRAAENAGGRFQILGPLQPDARRIFELTRFDAVFDIVVEEPIR